MNRRFAMSCVAAAGVSAGFVGGGMNEAACAIEPIGRKRARIKGLSLSAYSLRQKMKWFKGKQTDGQHDILTFIDYCASLNLDAAELTSYFFETPVKPAFVNAVKRRAHLMGIDISGGAMGNDFSHEPNSEIAKQQMSYFRTWIDTFADLGAPAVRIFAGRRPPKDQTEDQILQNVVANLEIALQHAEKRGVMLGLENHDLLVDLGRMKKVLNAIDSEWLGVTWDSANLAPTADPYADLATIAPYAITAQVKVTTKVDGKSVQADYRKLVDVLTNARYRGYIVMEYEEREDPFAAIPKFASEMRAAIASV